MSTAAIDTSRTNERLSAFQSEIGSSEPIDNHFDRTPFLKEFMNKKKMIDGGRQILYPIDVGANTTVRDFSDYDVFDTTAQDTAYTVVYPFVNKGGTTVISWEEIRETAGSDHKIFDLIKHKRDNLMSTIMNSLETDLFAASQASTKIQTLAIVVDSSSGSPGGLSASTESDWAATETASGAFSTQGLSDMRTLYNTLVDNGGMPDMIFTTLDVYQFYENEIDADVRYSTAQGTGGRGFAKLEFKGVPITSGNACNSGVLYMLDSKNTFFMVDTDGNFSSDDFQTPVNQKVSVSKTYFRGNLICNRRKSNGKLTGITA